MKGRDTAVLDLLRRIAVPDILKVLVGPYEVRQRRVDDVRHWRIIRRVGRADFFGLVE